MEVLDGKSVLVVTKDGAPVAVGHFQVEGAPFLDVGQRVELVFETDAMACRLRIPQGKIDEIKATWDGQRFTYLLPAGDSVWRGLAAPPPQPPSDDEQEPLPARPSVA